MPSVRILCTREVLESLEESQRHAIERNLQLSVAQNLSTESIKHEEDEVEIIWIECIRVCNMVEFAVEVLFSRHNPTNPSNAFLGNVHAHMLRGLASFLPPKIKSFSLWIRPQDGAIWDMQTR